MSKTSHSYHHGDLYAALINAASTRLESDGIDALSLRSLALDVGVSRSALYHHFKDKNDLLSAIAANGFSQWLAHVEPIFTTEGSSPSQQMRQFVRQYVGWAAAHPQLYELMFGRHIWKSGNPSEGLKAVAYPSFQFLVKIARDWQDCGLLPAKEDALRLAQVTWATLHGLARLLIDGIYADESHFDEMCDCATSVFTGGRLDR